MGSTRRKFGAGRGELWWGYLLLLAMAMVLWTGCATNPEVMGNRAWESGDRDLALNYYEQAIETGSRDPEVFYRAARVSMSQGSFAQAERYFSQSLRYGGGVEVARALAEFYVQTSNFLQAVRVYQYLLRLEEDVQPIYNNIGTALLYAGKFMDAETYLLLAQQMNPRDPIPYINLGVLYDRHIRNHPRAKSFYGCYLELSPGGAEARMVQTRLAELERTQRIDDSRVGLVCGEVFRLEEMEQVDLKEVFELEFGESGGGERHEIQIDRIRRGSETVQETGELRRAREAYQAGHFDRAFEALDGRSWSEYGQEERRILLGSLKGMGRFQEARERLELSLEEGPSPEVVEGLLSVYDSLSALNEKQRLCERFQGWAEYEEALANCP